MGKAFVTVKDSVVFEAGEIASGANTPFRVYSPYARAWRRAFRPELHAVEHRPDFSRLVKAGEIVHLSDPWRLEDIGFTRVELPIEPGERTAMARLEQFVPKMKNYAETRDFPAQEGTSALSPYFRFGNLSIRAAVRAALEVGGEGGEKWLNELIWRDFYQDVLVHHPRVVDRPFQSQYDDLVYPGSDDHFRAWTRGETGYPIVDAAMRNLRATGANGRRFVPDQRSPRRLPEGRGVVRPLPARL
jgi:deoxyribodipyrimidine photo-lyase